MDPGEGKIVLIGGALAVGVGLLFVKSKSSSTTYSAPGTGAAVAIAAAQQSDYALGEQTKVALANTAAGVYTNSNNNSTSLKLAAIQGASQSDLASLAAASTYNNLVEMDRTTAAKNVLDYNASTYQSKLTGITAHDTNVTALAEANLAKEVALTTSGNSIKLAQIASSAALGIASIGATTARQASSQANQTARILGADQMSTQKNADVLAHLTADNVAVQQAQAAVQVSGNQASAQKSSAMWGGISGIVGGLAKAIPFFSGGAPDGSGTSVVPFSGSASYDAVGSAVANQQADNSGPLAYGVPSNANTSTASFITPLLSIFGGH